MKCHRAQSRIVVLPIARCQSLFNEHNSIDVHLMHL